MSGGIRPLYLALIPGQGVELEAPAAWLERARQGLATEEQVQELRDLLQEVQGRLLSLEAGQNVFIRTREENGRTVAVIEVMGTQTAYAFAEGQSLVLGSEHNGKVVEVGRVGMVVTVPSTLQKGFSCLLRSVVNGGFEVRPGQGASFVPGGGSVVMQQRWDEVSVEGVGNGIFLVRRLPA